MDPSYGITGKLLIWFFAIVSIFYGTILLLYVNFQQVVHLSEGIVSKNYAISDSSKRMLENLISMEENEKNITFWRGGITSIFLLMHGRSLKPA
jgi:hypothetical protein